MSLLKTHHHLAECLSESRSAFYPHPINTTDRAHVLSIKGNYVACSGERVLNVNMNFYIVAKAIHLMNNIQYIFGGSKAKQGKKTGCDLVYTIKVGNRI
jgi:hypothetical protein